MVSEAVVASNGKVYAFLHFRNFCPTVYLRWHPSPNTKADGFSRPLLPSLLMFLMLFFIGRPKNFSHIVLGRWSFQHFGSYLAVVLILYFPLRTNSENSVAYTLAFGFPFGVCLPFGAGFSIIERSFSKHSLSLISAYFCVFFMVLSVSNLAFVSPRLEEINTRRKQ